MIDDRDVEAAAHLARELSPAEGTYTEDDYVMNLFETVLDYQMHTTAVVRALSHYRDHLWHEIRSVDDLQTVCDQFSDDQEGNTALAQHLWGYRMWTRASQLRRLAAYFTTIGVTDQDALRKWAANSSFKIDFEGKVKGLGLRSTTGSSCARASTPSNPTHTSAASLKLLSDGHSTMPRSWTS